MAPRAIILGRRPKPPPVLGAARCSKVNAGSDLALEAEIGQQPIAWQFPGPPGRKGCSAVPKHLGKLWYSPFRGPF